MRSLRAAVFPLAMAALLAGQNEPPAALRREAAAGFRDGRFAEAEGALRRLLAQSPKDPGALGFLGAVLDAEQKYDEAESAYKRALAQSSPSPALLNNLGNHYMARGQAEKARTYFERLLAVEPMNPNANLQLARMATDRKQGGRALEYLSRIKDSDAAVTLLRGEALHWAGKRAEALALLDRLAQDPDPRVQFSLGAAFARMALYDRAEAAFSAVLVRQPDDPTVLYNLGRAAARAQHYDRAQRVFETALRLQPDDVESLLELGRVYEAREDYNHAVYVLAKARKLAPKHDGVLLALARAAEDAGYYGDSALAYDEYLQLRPGDDSARRDRGLVYGYTHAQLDDGIKELNWYVHKHPEDPLGYYKLAQLSALENPEQALELLSQALRLDPNFADAHYARAFLLHQTGRSAESLPDLQAAVRGNPKDFHALDQLGLVYLTLERPAEAEKALRQALDLGPEQPEVLMHLGRALMDLGREREAQSVLDRFQRVRQQQPRPPRQNPGVIELAGLSSAEQQQRLIQESRRWILTRPDDPDLRFRLGSVLLAQGKLAEAAEVFRDLLAMNPSGRLSQDAGMALLRSGQFPLARDFLRRAATDRPEARLDLAIALFFAEGPRQALDELATVPDGEHIGDCLLLKARILDASGQTAEAERVLGEGLRHSPTRPLVAQQAALLLIRHNRNKEALELLSSAVESAPDDADLLLTKAIALGLAKRDVDSEKMLQRIESRWPEWDRTYLVHGLVLENRGQVAEASQKIHIALALGSRDPEAGCALARLSHSAAPDPKCECARGLYQLLLSPCAQNR